VRVRAERACLLMMTVTLACALPASAAAYPETWVSFPALMAQVRKGPLIRAIINPARSDVEIKFRDLDEWHAFYPRAELGSLQRLLYARHIRVLYASPATAAAAKPASAGHPLRYVAFALLAALALAGAGALLWRRRAHGRPPGATGG